MLREQGVARPAALLAVSPLLLSALVLLEQLVGVSGPQPMIATGVLAGSLVLACGMFALFEAGRSQAVVWRPRAVSWLAAVPVVLAIVALGLPSIMATAEISGVGGSFSGSWTLSGAESVAGWSAVALSLVMLAAIRSERPWMPVMAALGACAAWPWLMSVPTHVLNGWLAPGLQQYYGTEYGSVIFAPITNVLMIAAVIATAFGLVALSAARTGVLSRVMPAGLR